MEKTINQVNEFKAAFEKIAGEKGRCLIWKLRNELNWTPELFNDITTALWYSDEFQLYDGNTEEFTKQQLTDSYKDANGGRKILIVKVKK